jgi:predicted transcriptional regulator
MNAGSAPPEVTPRLVAKIVVSYVAHHSVTPDELSGLITSVGQSFRDLGKTAAPEEARTPAVPVRGSVRRDYVVCLECGFRAQVLRGHLKSRHGLTPDEYRARWSLPVDHPIIAPAYSERRSAIAQQIGLGRRRQTPEQTAAEPATQAGAVAEAGLDPAFAASLSVPRRGRKPRSAPVG